MSQDTPQAYHPLFVWWTVLQLSLSVIKLALLKTMLWALKTKYNELKPLINGNRMLFYAILCLFCGFEARESGVVTMT